MPFFGIRRSPLRMRRICSGISSAPTRSSTVGKSVVNQPTVRLTSTPSANSSRPCPSSSSRIRLAPQQIRAARARAVKRRSVIRVSWAPGALVSNASVSSSSSSPPPTSPSPYRLPGASNSRNGQRRRGFDLRPVGRFLQEFGFLAYFFFDLRPAQATVARWRKANRLTPQSLTIRLSEILQENSPGDSIDDQVMED